MVIKLIGNTILIEPLPDADMQKSAGGLFMVNKWKHSNLKFRVLAVGSGAWRRRKGKLKPVFDVPEVSVGDCIICRAELDPDVTKYAMDDGTGRLIIHSHGILMKWMER